MVSGHSFGGTCALTVAAQDKRIKGLVANDPYMKVVKRGVSVKSCLDLGDLPAFVQET